MWLAEGVFFSTTLDRKHTVQISTNFHTKNVCPHYAKPLLVAVAFVVRGCEVVVRCGVCCRVKMVSAVW